MKCTVWRIMEFFVFFALTLEGKQQQKIINSAKCGAHRRRVLSTYQGMTCKLSLSLYCCTVQLPSWKTQNMQFRLLISEALKNRKFSYLRVIFLERAAEENNKYLKCTLPYTSLFIKILVHFGVRLFSLRDSRRFKFAFGYFCTMKKCLILISK